MDSAATASAMDFDGTLSLLRAAQAGDAEARNELFRRHAPLAVETARLAFQWDRKRFEDYEDAAQDGLLAALEGIETFQPQRELDTPGSFQNWLRTCVRNAVVSGYRHHKAKKRGGSKVVLRLADLKRVDGSTLLLQGKELSPSQIARAGELSEQLEAELRKLPPREIEVVLCRHLDGMTHLEISRSLGISEEACRAAYFKAIKKLRAVLGGR